MLPVWEARARILEGISTRSELVKVAHGLGRYTTESLRAPTSLPAWDNSAMDGFAVRSNDCPGRLPVAGVIAAGDPPGRSLPDGSALRIMTGAPVPIGADTVVMREDVSTEGEVAVFEPAPAGKHIRRRGEDVTTGDEVVPAGIRLLPGELGLCAGLGMRELPVGVQPTVALVATGSELVPVGTVPVPGQKINSNAVALAAAVDQTGGVVLSSSIAADTREAVTDALSHGLRADVVISCGGVSVGDFDFVKDCLAPAGIELVFWKVAMKPGKPLVFGRSGEKLFFGLPGNPVSAAVCFELFVRPALLTLQGARQRFRPTEHVVLEDEYRKVAGRSHFLQATLSPDRKRPRVADITRKQGSGRLASMVAVDALIEIPAATTEVARGESVLAHLLGP